MNNFYFSLPTQIYFGKNRHLEVGKYINDTEKVLLIFGSNRIRENGLLSEIENSLKLHNISYLSIGGVSPNPRLSKVFELADICRENNVTFILAVGGGSVMDTAKAVALASEDEKLWDFFSGTRKCELQIKTKIGVIPTIAASGSETSSTTVITNDFQKESKKIAFSYWQLKPVFAILVPDLTLSVSWEDTACGGVDIFSHVLERYFTTEHNNDLTDRLCEATMKTVVEQMYKLKNNLQNYDARAELLWAGTLAHCNFLSTGRKCDWATHTIEHEFSGIYDIKHGAGISILFPAWMRYVYKTNVYRFAKYAREVFSVSEDNDLKCAELGIELTINFFKSLDMPTRFSEIGVKNIDSKQIAEAIARDRKIGSFLLLDVDDIVNIIKSVE